MSEARPRAARGRSRLAEEQREEVPVIAGELAPAIRALGEVQGKHQGAAIGKIEIRTRVGGKRQDDLSVGRGGVYLCSKIQGTERRASTARLGTPKQGKRIETEAEANFGSDLVAKVNDGKGERAEEPAIADLSEKSSPNKRIFPAAYKDP